MFKEYAFQGIQHQLRGRGLNFSDTISPINGLRQLILDKQQKVMKVRGNADEMVVIIKPGKEATYKNTMDILDEMAINNVTRYYLDDEDEIDKKLIGIN